jgi:hypothetical protein
MAIRDFENLGVFYLGRPFDPVTREAKDEAMLYESADLVTHAVCVGMTGSGKTGLCVSLLEEAAMDGIPALVIDPKGDLGNLMLQFPQLRGEDFEPWVNAEDAQKEGLSAKDFAAKQAAFWKEGLAKWGQDGERIARLHKNAEFAIYTPGSSAGIPLTVLKSFDAPKGAAAEDRELVRDRISTTATAVLSLLGIDADPLKSREHILISNLLATAWNEEENLDLVSLIGRIQKPPMARVGVVDMESFFPEKERHELAMQINNLLASPGFEQWMEGEPLDIGKLLYTPEGKARVAILSIAHLTDAERMFLVSLVLNEMLSWTRAQSGTTSLRALLYMDEIFGYFPPTANPPSKKPLLTLLKQARAFGVGVVLATQNPVDLDYKGLANCGTWFIGRLQTERDKDRLLEGLEGAAGEGGGKFDRQHMEQILAGLGKRVFLMNNVHDSGPTAFESRWAMSYLRGPLTRSQIKLVMANRKAAAPATTNAAKAAPAAMAAGMARPVLPPEIPNRFLAVRGSGEGVSYQPMLFGEAEVRFEDKKAGVDRADVFRFLTPVTNNNVAVNWDDALACETEANELEAEPVDGAQFSDLPAVASKSKSYAQWNKDLVNWVFGSQQITVFKSASAKAYSTPGESEAEFRARMTHGGREQRDAAILKLRQKYASKVATLEERLRKARQSVQKESEQASQQKWATGMSILGSVAGALLGGGRRGGLLGAAGGAMGKVQRASKESGDVARAEETVEAVEAQLKELNAQIEAEVAALQTTTEQPSDVETVNIKPKKTGITVRYFTLVWTPYRDGEAAW